MGPGGASTGTTMTLTFQGHYEPHPEVLQGYCGYRDGGDRTPEQVNQGILKEILKYHCTIDLLFDWFGISCMKTDNICFYLQNRLIQTSQTGGQ
jgi:hypothetical protein